MVETTIRPGDESSFDAPSAELDPETPEVEQRADLADAIVWLARWHGFAPVRSDIVHGIPQTDDGPSFGHLSDMGRRCGLDLKAERAAPHRISPVTPPVAVFKKSGETAIITRIDSTRHEAHIVDPLSAHLEPVRVPIAELRGFLKPFVVYAVPDRSLLASGDTDPSFGPTEFQGHWFWSAVRRFWPNYVQVVIAAFLINLLGLALPLFIMNVYDRVIPNLAIPTLWALTAGVALAIVFDAILKLLRARIVDETGRRVDMTVAGRLFDKVVGLKLAGRPESGGAFASRMRDFDAVRDVLTSSSVVAVTDLVFIGIFLWVLWWLVGPLVLVPMIAVPVVLVLTLLIQAPLSAALARTQADSATRQGILVETLTGIESLKASGAEGWMRRLWDHAVAASSRASARSRFWATTAVAIVASTGQIVAVTIIVWGVFLVIAGEITVGALIAANILAGRVLAPLSNVAQTMTRIGQAKGALSALNRVMAQEGETGAGGGGQAIEGAVAFSGVTFTYPGAPLPALKDVSFSVKPGERIGVVGRVGCGKSTLGRLISGLYAAHDGLVSIDGLDIRQYGVAGLRDAIGYCPQEPHLFSGTLRSNIVMGRPFASEDALQRAVQMSGVAAFAGDHPEGLAMPIAEAGRSLSGGQRQAVALARALLREPTVLFLDEPSASMDTRTEAALMASLAELGRSGLTLFIATHRHKLLDAVDRLLVFEKGRLVADGRKADVLAELRRLGQEAQDAKI